MSLDMTIAPKCYPVSVEEVKQHLRLNTTTAEEDFYIENLIASATTHAEQKTGRVFVDSEWSWTPSEKEMNGSAVPLPVVPVTSVEVFDSSLSLLTCILLNTLRCRRKEIRLLDLSPL